MLHVNSMQYSCLDTDHENDLLIMFNPCSLTLVPRNPSTARDDICCDDDNGSRSRVLTQTRKMTPQTAASRCYWRISTCDDGKQLSYQTIRLFGITGTVFFSLCEIKIKPVHTQLPVVCIAYHSNR